MSSTYTTSLSANLRMALERFSVGLIALAVMVIASPGQASERDDQYLEAFHLIQQADGLQKAGDNANALTKYQKAEAMLQQYRRAYPDFGQKMVGFRLSYTSQKIAELGSKPEAEATNLPVAGSGGVVTTSGVKLLSAGAEPRKVLRLHPKAGDKQRVDMTMKMAMEIQAPGAQNQGMKLPVIKMPLEVTIKSISAGGDISYESSLGQVSVEETGGNAEVANAMKSAMANLKGTGTGTITSRGIVKSSQFDLGSGNSQTMPAFLRLNGEQMRDYISQVSAPFPEEAVGPGAKWELASPIKFQDMNISQTATYELVSIDGESVVLKSSLVQSAANQKIQNPAMPGIKLDLTKMSGNGTGESKLELSQILPTEATADSHSEVNMGMNMGGQKQSMSMKMDINLKFQTQ